MARKSLMLNGDPAETAQTLVDSPGTWFVIAKRPFSESRALRSAGNRLSSGRFVTFEKYAKPGGHWEVTVRKQEGDEVWMYARWVD